MVFFETKAFFFNFHLVLIGIKKIMEILSFLQIPSHLQVNEIGSYCNQAFYKKKKTPHDLLFDPKTFFVNPNFYGKNTYVPLQLIYQLEGFNKIKMQLLTN